MVSDVTGLLLMGGRSQRMGQDKAYLPWHGELMWQRQFRTLSQVANPVWRSVPHGTRPAPDLIVDPLPFPGPLPAIVASLRALTNYWLLVLAVDLPRVDAALLHDLIAHRRADGVTIVAGDGGSQPLLSIWHHSVADILPSPANLANASVNAVLRKIPTSEYRLPHERSLLLANMNTPEDLRR